MGLRRVSSWSSNRRAYLYSCLIAAGLSAVFFVGILLLSGVNFRSNSYTTRFYVVQAQSFLDMRWNVPLDVLGLEGFRHSGLWFMYYGPFPALLRLPTELLRPGLSPLLTQAAMFAAWAVAMSATADLCWRIRCLVRDEEAPVTRLERWAVGGFLFSVGAGSVLIFLASQAWVYHEAELWGTALAIASFDLILAYLMKPSKRLLIFASVLATFSICSRASVGLGPVAALGLLAVASIATPTQHLFGVTTETRRRWLRAFAIGAACFIPLAIYSYTNWAKFGTLFVFPTDQQLMSKINPHRRDFLEKSGGSYFGLQFIPTTLWTYLRPNGLGLRSLFPWVTFPGASRVFGGATFDAMEPTSSLTSSMPLLSILAAFGFVAAWFRSWGGAHLKKLRAPLLGAIVSGLAVLPFGYIAQRYLTDFFPLLILSGIVGLHIILRWSASSTTSIRKVQWAWRILGAALLFSVVINVALAIDYHWTTPWVREDQVAQLVETQYRVQREIPGGTAPYVERGRHLPWPPLPRGTTFVVGDCDGVYWSQGIVPSLAWSPWMGLARTRSTGEYNFDVRFKESSEQTIEPLVVRGEPGRLQSLVVIVSSNKAQFGFVSEGHENLPHGPRTADGFFMSLPVSIKPGQNYRMRVVMDPENGKIVVFLDDKLVFHFYQLELTPRQSSEFIFPTSKVAIGVNPGKGPIAPKFLGEIKEVQSQRPTICDLVDPKSKR